MNLKTIGTGIAALSLLVASSSAQAADIPPPVYKGGRSVIAYYNWTGFYAGINGGYAWARSTWDSPGTITAKGWLVGGTLGYNYQVGSLVYGIEGDWDWSNVKGSATCGVVFTCTIEQRWLATFRGRLGFAADRFLVYATAGGAYANLRATTTNPLLAGASSDRLGWTLGAGIEYAFLGNWTTKIEYLYVDLGRFNCGGNCVAGVAPNNISFRENIVRVGLNYKFSGPVYSRY